MEKNAFKQWMIETYDADALGDISRFGANAGWSHMTYHTDINALYDEYEDSIWDILYDYAESCGYTVIGLLAQHDKNIGSGNDFRSYMVWSAAEIVAHDLSANLA